MLLKISTTGSPDMPATDLGFLLHKSPDRLHSFDLPFGKAHVFYPEATAERATAALYLQVDAVGLVRHSKGPRHFQVDEYVNDRPFVASSLLAVAISKVFGTALNGRSKMRPDLVDVPLPLTAELSAVRDAGNVERFLAPLGWEIEAQDVPLDQRFPDWGQRVYRSVTLRGQATVTDLLRQLYVLAPVIDAGKHYWVGDEEVEKLVRHGGTWLATHPERDRIVGSYLRYQGKLVAAAMTGLAALEPATPPQAAGVRDERGSSGEDSLEEPMKLNEQRLKAVHEVLRKAGARRILDLGCGSGKLLARLAEDETFQEIVGMDVAARELRKAKRSLASSDRRSIDRRIRLLQGSLTYRDQRLAGFDAAALIEVVEHVEPTRLAVFEQAVFRHAQPGMVVVTTPNIEYNALFERLVRGRYRHEDHRFEWTRAEFASWAETITETYGYRVEFEGIGPVHSELGAPTQMAIFTRETSSVEDVANK